MPRDILATLNPNALGPGLTLEQGGLVVRTTQPNLNNARKVLATLPNGSGEYYFECQFFTRTRPASMPAECRVGVSIANGSIITGAGVDAGSYAFMPSVGVVYNNNATIPGTMFPIGERVVIGVYCFLSPSVASLSFMLNGSYARTVSLPAGNFWVPCVTVAGGEAGDTAAYLNFGQTGFVYPRVTAGV